MFVNHIIKTLTGFGHSCLTVFREPFSVLSAVIISLLVCVVKLFFWCVAVYYLRVWLPDVLVCGRLGCELFTTKPSKRQVYQALTHIDNIQPHNKQASWRRKQAEKYSVVTALSTEYGPLKMVKQEWPKTVGVLMMWFTNIFNVLVF
jgi:hypothetical protein